MKRVAIDIGHAEGTGAWFQGVNEHEVCAGLAEKLAEHLRSFKTEEHEVDIVDFENETNSGDLVKTVKTVNTGGYDAVVSLHMDWSDNPDAHGAHVCYYSKKGKVLAEAVAQRLCPQMPGRSKKVVCRTDLYVLKRTNCTAILVECGFGSNEGDLAWVLGNGDKVALAIALGVADGLEQL